MADCKDCSAASSCSSMRPEGSCSTSSAPTFIHPAKGSKIANVIAVGSGKGGVGKSTVSAVLALSLARNGYKVGILDADITGPSMAKAFGLKENIYANEAGLFVPTTSMLGIRVLSLNLLLADETEPVIWRGPVITTVIKQFYSDTDWGNLDVLIIDMPPGTGDVPLTIFQNIPVDRFLLVSTPQDLVSVIVHKACKMANMMQVQVLGLVENMASFTDEETGKVFYPFGLGRGEMQAAKMEIPYLDSMPIDSNITKFFDNGRLELLAGDFLKGAVSAVSNLVERKRRIRARMQQEE